MMYTYLQIKEVKRLSTLPLVELVCLQSLFWEMTSCVLLGHMERSLSLSPVPLQGKVSELLPF